MLTLINKLKQILIKDEGITLTTDVNSINFVGNGVTATNVGNDVTVTVNGVTGSTQQLELFGSRPTGVIAVSNTASGIAAVTNYINFVVQQTGGGAASGTVYWQFVVPSNYVSGGVFRITTRRSFATVVGQSLSISVYVDDVLSNISAQTIFPVAQNAYSTFTTAALLTAVTPGVSTITVQVAYTTSISGGTYFFRDLSLNYTS